MNKFDDLFAEKVSLTLTKEEALLLFEMLSDSKDEHAIPIRNSAQRRAVWRITSSFEKALAEPFRKDYLEILEEAKQRMIGERAS